MESSLLEANNSQRLMLIISFEATSCPSENFQVCKGYENTGKTSIRYTHSREGLKEILIGSLLTFTSQNRKLIGFFFVTAIHTFFHLNTCYFQYR